MSLTGLVLESNAICGLVHSRRKLQQQLRAVQTHSEDETKNNCVTIEGNPALIVSILDQK